MFKSGAVRDKKKKSDTDTMQSFYKVSMTIPWSFSRKRDTNFSKWKKTHSLVHHSTNLWASGRRSVGSIINAHRDFINRRIVSLICQFVVFYRNTFPRYMSAKYLILKQEKLNVTYFLCQVSLALLIRNLCVAEVQSWSIAYWKQVWVPLIFR